MDPKNDPLLKMAEQMEQQRQQQFWAKQRESQLPSLATIAAFGKVGQKIFKFWWTNFRSIYVIYGLSFYALGLAGLFLWGAVALQRPDGFFSLGLGLGTVDALLFLIGAALSLGTLWYVIQAFRNMIWVTQILVLFFLYRLAFWWIHHWDGFWQFLGAYFFCLVMSLLVEGSISLWQKRRDGRFAT